MKRVNKNTRTMSRHRKHNYGQLEDRKMLTTFSDAPLFTGTSQADVVEVRFVDENTVDIRINDTLQEGIDSSNGIRLNLGRQEGGLGISGSPAGDSIEIDQRITNPISISGAESITVIGDEGNLVQTSFRVGETPSPPPGTFLLGDPLIVIGNINGNISFNGANTIVTGAGDDVFNLSNNGATGETLVSGARVLGVRAGAGDDVIRFNGQQPRVSNSIILDGGLDPGFGIISAEGEAGDDRFVYRDLGRGLFDGGDGFDIVDRRNSTDLRGDGRIQISLDGAGNDLTQGTQISLEDSIERYIVSADTDTSAILTDDDPTRQYDWEIAGSVTTLTTSGSVIELLNFNQFVGSGGSEDNFFVSETAQDISIFNADFAQISSTRDASQGNLDAIQHQILFENVSLWVGGFLGSIAETDGIDSPTVQISGAGGDGLNVAFRENQTITGIGGGTVEFAGEVDELTILGSNNATDYIAARAIWAPTIVETGGGDDTFMIGSTNRDADGDLARIQGPLDIRSGDGTDRIYINNQNDSRQNQTYTAVGSTSFGNRITVEADGGQQTETAQITFDSSVTVARVNGSLEQPNLFNVLPSETTRFVIDGSGSSSQLRVSDNVEGSIVRSTADNASGAVLTQFNPVNFFGIEDVEFDDVVTDLFTRDLANSDTLAGIILDDGRRSG